MIRNERLQTAGRTLDHAAGIYDLVNNIVSFGRCARMRAEAIGSMDFKPEDHILDLGCGTGTMTLQIAERLNDAGRIEGIDAAERMIAVAEKHLRKTDLAGRCHFSHALAEKLPFEDESFDYCFSSMFYHHLPFDLKRQSMSEAYRVLRKGGIFLTIDIDRPGNPLTRFMTTCGYLVLMQRAIKENADGVLPELINQTGFAQLELIKRKWNLISMLRAIKPKGSNNV
jgi:ubiquinone/menaquinone biosynthesis C-methylase UbiE